VANSYIGTDVSVSAVDADARRFPFGQSRPQDHPYPRGRFHPSPAIEFAPGAPTTGLCFGRSGA
jgi:hypothetical protein